MREKRELGASVHWRGCDYECCGCCYHYHYHYFRCCDWSERGNESGSEEQEQGQGWEVGCYEKDARCCLSIAGKFLMLNRVKVLGAFVGT